MNVLERFLLYTCVGYITGQLLMVLIFLFL